MNKGDCKKCSVDHFGQVEGGLSLKVPKHTWIFPLNNSQLQAKSENFQSEIAARAEEGAKTGQKPGEEGNHEPA